MNDEGHAIHYSAVTRGTTVYASDGTEVGKVDHVVDNYNEHILDGFVIEMADGKLRFVDAPEVERTFERAVTLSISAAEAAQLPAPEKAAPDYKANVGAGRLGRMFGRGWKRR